MASVILLPDPKVLELVALEVDEETKTITIMAVTTSSEAMCPLCQLNAYRVQSWYVRTLADLPCFGQRVRWLIQVRRFWCDNATCKRKIFTERLPTCAPAYARRLVRQKETLCELAFALGGKVGEQVAQLLGMATSHDTLLRLMRQSPTSEVRTPHILGVDDFAWKKGNRYGTILVDLEKHAVIDLLPDREKKTFKKWLKDHPGVQVISRDRASAYADAAKEGAPQATQVADRYHLLVNLRDHIKSFLNGKRASLPKVEVDDRLVTARKDQQTSANEEVEALAALMQPLVTTAEPEFPQDVRIATFTRDTRREKWFHKPNEVTLAQSQLRRKNEGVKHECHCCVSR